MSYSGPIQIFNRDGWTLDSYGNGAAYTLRHSRDGESRSCFFQGDDATEFRERFDSYDEHGLNAIQLFGDYAEIMHSDAESQP